MDVWIIRKQIKSIISPIILFLAAWQKFLDMRSQHFNRTRAAIVRDPTQLR